ncbi:hypothetical protein EJ02DRAFT_509032 [Clathrospora elynae]|uniref:Uncharacterized protein n=1 Tax=Clathrospora elynae TaxID=706981 RepID=A0A6A5SYY6_9PLEO|nr:hypothetical protein EJ02DRAFT_509032 [Clathrospora elynae]
MLWITTDISSGFIITCGWITHDGPLSRISWELSGVSSCSTQMFSSRASSVYWERNLNESGLRHSKGCHSSAYSWERADKATRHGALTRLYLKTDIDTQATEHSHFTDQMLRWTLVCEDFLPAYDASNASFNELTLTHYVGRIVEGLFFRCSDCRSQWPCQHHGKCRSCFDIVVLA